MTKGEVIVVGMNLMGYDVMALGPKELSLGQGVLAQRMEEAEFPMLSANVVLSGTDELFAEPYTILEVGGHRVGVIGLTRVPGKPQKGFQVLDPQDVALQYVPEVATQADTVVILTNMTYPTALALAAPVQDIDLLVAARPDQTARQSTRVPSTGTIGVTTERPAKRHTGRVVGRLTVTVESDGTLSEESWAAVSMVKEIADNAQMTALLNEYR